MRWIQQQTRSTQQSVYLCHGQQQSCHMGMTMNINNIQYNGNLKLLLFGHFE